MTQAILRPELPPDGAPARARITAAWLRDETEAVNDLLAQATLPPAEREQVIDVAAGLVTRVRARAKDQSAVESFMRQYDLSSEEGVLLMCVAEALLRIPDKATADKLIRDKLGEADWKKHLGQSESLFVNASTWGLMLTGHLVQLAEDTRHDFTGALKRLAGRAGEPAIRLAVRQAMRIMGHQFVMGRSIDEALDRCAKKEYAVYRYSYDMLGESALTAETAERYQEDYRRAIARIGARGPFANHTDAPSISVKLSALHPRYEVAKREDARRMLTAKLLELSQLAMKQGIALSVDAEEADRLELSLDIIGDVFAHPSLAGWNGLGIVVQAYSKRTPFVIDWLIETARAAGRRWYVRLVKGAYWDAEIKRAQEQGLPGYPLYTRKPNTDVSYLACAHKLFDAGSELIYPQFATHNAHSIAAVHHIARGRPFEFQRLHGMGTDLYAEVIGADKLNVPCRVYAPVGTHEDLLPYLVRRLLENGANTSFVNRVVDETLPVRELVADPCETVRRFASIPHPRIPLPVNLYGELRKNSMGINFSNDNELKALAEAVAAKAGPWTAEPLVPGAKGNGPTVTVTNPADRRQVVGSYVSADAALVDRALANAVASQPDWDRLPAASRAAILEHAAEQLEARRAEFIALCVREAGKSLPDAIAEVREAADFLRYYATMSRRLFGQPEQLPGPTGESNQLFLNGRGVFVCISPWNFPLAIFLGQISAALAAGNSVIAKPAEQTSLIGYAAVKLLHEAGVPLDVLQYLPGDGATVGAALTKDPRVAGVAFTGSTETAWAINRALAARNAPIAALIAETGGQNAMIADSSALPEQIVKDVIASAFQSAGQRCSAARVLFVQEDIADKVTSMLAGAMAELKVGDPGQLSTDVGPVIDEDAKKILVDHAARMDQEAKLIAEAALDADIAAHGTFFAPRAYEIPSLTTLTREVFGPVLHVIRWKGSELAQVVEQINATGYGLTLGVHSRIDDTVEYIRSHARVGNCYVNRNQIGAVVGVQPFGGESLSGTGPKAGGPHYLLRFAGERTLTINTTAAGGNASLLTIGE
ncbi:bifunctional proline dehydrogenase/L-glutamate gamma-semialdehyde dehydrogenase [Rhodanobacter thiooxydans]|uniref:Bifunctional protein PutA n=1 Tax=Rhodanobacter thiooxydans TaxID=416169 RepID=A0A154QGN4_9GAMM|nr:bifunctional proline dehydrogenase/L-glutamate gamma-semialdehyde dehydrogenase PutA [Rhodanobacter thiooxydans]EIL98873.1 bifunctional proline dehydrogenase/pyrroline-5-carboxylate dehydrogenase [Rhodanobacter thiooxydans LCS2]KZC23326.1 bifunctional proline dehydrogenase/L-glutamate gamma-semialdehyde dehydrogenase [Rhodanobacter thiooxydans]MCW0201202.1 bifunctional proline dehydrogenase/L-glutamate gamma-semialdehyde dehydrogenase PutA [Rhodanobacter thiooxydans]